MIQAITTLEDVKQFTNDLIGENLIFHPDDDFNDYIDVDNNPIFTPQEAEIRNKLMSDSFDVCNANNVEIYELMLEIIQSKTN